MSIQSANKLFNEIFLGDAEHLQRFVVEEVEGADTISVSMRGGFQVLRGASFPVTVGGGKHPVFGSTQSLLSATTVEFDDTEMEVRWDAPFMRVGDIQVVGADLVFSPEGMLALFQRIATRARQCNVTVGTIARIGLLRAVEPTPNRGYTVDPATGQPGAAGVNYACKLKWQWAGDGIPVPPATPPKSGSEIAGGLSAGVSGLSSALTDDAFDPGLIEALGDGLANIRKDVSGLRKTVKGIGDLAKAPAKLANAAIATARSLGNVVNDVHNALSDIGDEYAAARDGIAGLVGMRRAKAQAKASLDQILDNVTAVFDALARRKPKIVGVRPGQSLVQIAAANLGDGGRWGEIAALNELPGNVVPPGTYEIEIPPRGG